MRAYFQTDLILRSLVNWLLYASIALGTTMTFTGQVSGRDLVGILIYTLPMVLVFHWGFLWEETRRDSGAKGFFDPSLIQKTVKFSVFFLTIQFGIQYFLGDITTQKVLFVFVVGILTAAALHLTLWLKAVSDAKQEVQ